MRRPIIRGGPWKNWTEPTIDVSLETRERPSSLLSIGTLSPLLYIPSLWLISRHSHRLIFSASRRPRPPPYPGPRPILLHAGAVMLPLMVQRHRSPRSTASAGPRGQYATYPPLLLHYLSLPSLLPTCAQKTSLADARTGVKMTRGTNIRGLRVRGNRNERVASWEVNEFPTLLVSVIVFTGNTLDGRQRDLKERLCGEKLVEECLEGPNDLELKIFALTTSNLFSFHLQYTAN